MKALKEGTKRKEQSKLFHSIITEKENKKNPLFTLNKEILLVAFQR